MSTNNKVFQVLVAPATVAAILPAGGTLDSLAVGQLGIFDSKTNLSINPNGSNIPEFFYFAVKNANGEIDFSAGQEIQGKGIRSISHKPYQAFQAYVAEVEGDFLTNLKPNEFYTLRLEVKSNEILQRQGTVQFTSSIVVQTGDEPDVQKFLKDFRDQINADSANFNEMFTLSILDEDDDPVDVDNYTGDGSGIKFQIVGKETLVNKYSDINTRFQNIRQTVVEIAMPDGYINAGASVTVVNAGTPEEGSGYNLRQLEYWAGGWNGRPGVYRQSSVTGLPFPGFNYRASEDGKYNIFDIAYANHSNAGWGDYWNDLQTTIGVDTSAGEDGANGTALTAALITFFQAVISKYAINYGLNIA